MTTPTLITGLGAISPLGLRLEDHAASAGALDRFCWAFADIDEAERLASRGGKGRGVVALHVPTQRPLRDVEPEPEPAADLEQSARPRGGRQVKGQQR